MAVIQSVPDKPYDSSRRLLNLILLAMVVVTAVVDFYILYLVGSLLVFAYSGSNDPTSVNGLGFPIAMVTLVIYGTPAGAVTFLAVFGYFKTRPPKPVSTVSSPESTLNQPPTAPQA